MEKVFELATTISTPLGLGGFIGAVMFFVLQRILARNVGKVTAARALELLLVIVHRLFLLALAAMVLGFLGYVFIHWPWDRTVGSRNSAEITGAVKDGKTAAPIRAARVSTSARIPFSTVYSDSDGVFVLRVPTGNQDTHVKLNVSADGYQSQERNVAMGQVTALEFFLTSASVTPPELLPHSPFPGPNSEPPPKPKPPCVELDGKGYCLKCAWDESFHGLAHKGSRSYACSGMAPGSDLLLATFKGDVSLDKPSRANWGQLRISCDGLITTSSDRHNQAPLRFDMQTLRGKVPELGRVLCYLTNTHAQVDDGSVQGNGNLGMSSEGAKFTIEAK